jgi:hypothetical protein
MIAVTGLAVALYARLPTAAVSIEIHGHAVPGTGLAVLTDVCLRPALDTVLVADGTPVGRIAFRLRQTAGATRQCPDNRQQREYAPAGMVKR